MITDDEEHPALRSLVNLRLLDFCSTEGTQIVIDAKVIFFNNFGPWFDPLIQTFHDQVRAIFNPLFSPYSSPTPTT